MIEEQVLELIHDIAEFYKEDNWLTVKKFLVRYSHPKLRKNFSTRHDKTKKHTINTYEQNIINYYKEKYSVRLRLHEKDKHEEQVNN